MKSKGAIALSRTGKTQPQIAQEVGCSRPLVFYWLQGEKRPGPRFRERLAELYAIDGEDWDLDPSGDRLEPPRAGAAPALPAPFVASRPPPSEEAALPLAVGGAFRMAHELQELARDQLHSLRTGDGTPLERARVSASLSSTITTLAKLTGDFDIARRMTKLPLWKRLEVELAKALRGHPDVARKVAEVFEALDAEQNTGG